MPLASSCSSCYFGDENHSRHHQNNTGDDIVKVVHQKEGSVAERRWGKSRLRRAAEKRGYTVSNPQFDAYVDEGLIPPGEGPEGKLHWLPEVVDMLLAIRGLGETVRPLPRRLIHLYCHPLFIQHMDAERIRTAEMTIVPSIVDADPKMLFVYANALALERAEASAGDYRAVALLPVFEELTPPPAALWAGILSVYDPSGFAWTLPRAYDQADALAILPEAPPFAELVTMLTVRLVVAYTLFAIRREQQNGLLAEATANPAMVEMKPFITELGAERIITELGEDAAAMPAARPPLPRRRAAKTKRPA